MAGLSTHRAYNVMTQELFRLQTSQVVKRRNNVASSEDVEIH